jgi:hypothetical protein
MHPHYTQNAPDVSHAVAAILEGRAVRVFPAPLSLPGRRPAGPPADTGNSVCGTLGLRSAASGAAPPVRPPHPPTGWPDVPTPKAFPCALLRSPRPRPATFRGRPVAASLGLGSGRGRAQLTPVDRLDSCDGERGRVWDGRKLVISTPPVSIALKPDDAPANALRVRFVTPTELKCGGILGPRARFSALFRPHPRPSQHALRVLRNRTARYRLWRCAPLAGPALAARPSGERARSSWWRNFQPCIRRKALPR